MTKTPPRLRRARAPILALLVLLALLSPILLFGESPGAFGLLLVAAGLLGGGLVLGRTGGGDARTIGKILAVVGLVMLIVVAGLLWLLLAGLGRPY
jgi:peptidoglycan/LPS O-acetylase OafA/YrhL